jgi:hypothetical protein
MLGNVPSNLDKSSMITNKVYIWISFSLKIKFWFMVHFHFIIRNWIIMFRNIKLGDFTEDWIIIKLEKLIFKMKKVNWTLLKKKVFLSLLIFFFTGARKQIHHPALMVNTLNNIIKLFWFVNQWLFNCVDYTWWRTLSSLYD